MLWEAHRHHHLSCREERRKNSFGIKDFVAFCSPCIPTRSNRCKKAGWSNFVCAMLIKEVYDEVFVWKKCDSRIGGSIEQKQRREQLEGWLSWKQEREEQMMDKK